MAYVYCHFISRKEINNLHNFKLSPIHIFYNFFSIPNSAKVISNFGDILVTKIC